MSYLLSPVPISLLTIAKTFYQQKKGQNLTSLIPKFTLFLSSTMSNTTCVCCEKARPMGCLPHTVITHERGGHRGTKHSFHENCIKGRSPFSAACLNSVFDALRSGLAGLTRVTDETSGRVAGCPFPAVSSELTRLRFGGPGGRPCQLRVPRLTPALLTTAHNPARPQLSPAASPLNAGSGAGSAQQRRAARTRGAARTRRQADRPASVAGCRRAASRCQRGGHRGYTRSRRA